MSTLDATRDAFAPDGPVAARLPGWEPRPQQVDMALAVARALDDEQRVVIEAATGTGKTVAYLVPALLSGRKTVVSTATKNLQEQLFNKDLPLLRDIVPRPFRAVCLKGRQNYLCLWQYHNFVAAPLFRDPADVPHWPSVRDWAESTPTGDRAELASLPDDWATWTDLSIGADGCLGRECPHWADCHVVRARREAANADVVIVNHHLFFADLTLRTRQEHLALLPDYEVLVFDEAHNLEEVAASWFGERVSNLRVIDLLGDIRALLRREKIESPLVLAAYRDVTDTGRRAFGLVKRALGDADTRVAWSTLRDGPDAARIADAFSAMNAALASLRVALGTLASGGEVTVRLATRVGEVADTLGTLVRANDDDRVFTAERRGRMISLESLPIDLGEIFRRVVFGTCGTQIYTSATLTTSGDFRFFRRRIGLPSDVQELRLEPVFDYRSRSLLFLPPDLPDPGDPDFIDRIAPTMAELIDICDGRAFLLFTSHRNLRRAHAVLAPLIRQQVLVQGERSRTALLDAFRADVHSVLFATSSFWEGVDVQGEALSLVIIDKLPFANHLDPIVAARIAHIRKRGGNPFVELQIPNAILSLKQGFGRLIRHRNDFGIIALMDNRILGQRYGMQFIDSLPRTTRTTDIAAVRRWWNHRRREVETPFSL